MIYIYIYIYNIIHKLINLSEVTLMQYHIYIFTGCVFHGCTTCFPDDRTKTTHPVTKHSMNELYYMTKNREMVLKDLGYQYKCIWEHEFNRQLKNDADMREYISNLDITDRLNHRDSFYGGRTNAIKLFHEIQQPGETIEYYDFTRYVCVFCS